MPVNTIYPNIPDNFVTNLKKTRSVKKLSLKALARLVGCHPAYISEVENGKRNVSYERALVFNQVLDMGFDLPKPDLILIAQVKGELGWLK